MDWEKFKDIPVQFTNIVFPGGIFFMIPENKAISKMRRNIEEEIERFQAHWNEDQKSLYNSLNVHWAADFKRKLFKSYGLNSRNSYLFLVSPQGQLLSKVQQDNPAELSDFVRLLSREVEKMHADNKTLSTVVSPMD